MNFIEIYFRRPIAFRSSTIGIWFNILEVLAYLAIVANVKTSDTRERKQDERFFDFLGFFDRFYIGIFAENSLSIYS